MLAFNEKPPDDLMPGYGYYPQPEFFGFADLDTSYYLLIIETFRIRKMMRWYYGSLLSVFSTVYFLLYYLLSMIMYTLAITLDLNQLIRQSYNYSIGIDNLPVNWWKIVLILLEQLAMSLFQLTHAIGTINPFSSFLTSYFILT